MAEQLSFPFFQRIVDSSPSKAMRERWGHYDVAIDFDGVLHDNNAPWTKSNEVNGAPIAGALEAVQAYNRAGLCLVVFSARANDASAVTVICTWLDKHGFPSMGVTANKVSATLYIDDRGYQFTGDNWPGAYEILRFSPWNSSKGRSINGEKRKAHRTTLVAALPEPRATCSLQSGPIAG